jgi:hypothetical protein
MESIRNYDNWKLALPPHYDAPPDKTAEKLESAKWLLSTLQAVGNNYCSIEVDGVRMADEDTLEFSMDFQVGDDLGLANALEKMAAVIRSLHTN